jgi:hypothetical protein
VRRHADKRGPPYTEQEAINTRADRLADNAHTTLPEEFKARHNCLHFPEQKISLCLHGQKVISKITRNVAHSIHRPELEAYLREKVDWGENTWGDIAWPSFKIAFNKILTARHPTIRKLISSFGVPTNDKDATTEDTYNAASVKITMKTGNMF